MISDGQNFYTMMLGLPENITSPNAYELLRLELFEDDEETIREAAVDANQKLLAWQNSEYHAECDHLLDEVVKARAILLDAQRRAKYDRRLRRRAGPYKGASNSDFDRTFLLSLFGIVAAAVFFGVAIQSWGLATVAVATGMFAVVGAIVSLAIRFYPILLREMVPRISQIAAMLRTSLRPIIRAFQPRPVVPRRRQTTIMVFLSISLVLGLAIVLNNSLLPVATFLQPSPEKTVTAPVSDKPRRLLRCDAPQITNGAGMSLVLIRPGEFQMGSAGGYRFGLMSERPQHSVRITRPFYLSSTEVTQQQWKSVMGTTPWTRDSMTRETANCPATNVSWDDAQQFCVTLGSLEGQAYRLPTEAEWEYACRAGTTTDYHFGDTESLLDDYAWFTENTFRFANEVGQKKANPFGLYDMHGNVWEWCLDWYDDRYYANSPLEDPQGPSSGSSRVIRGGAWGLGASYLRSAYRGSHSPDGDYQIGFRVVVECE